MEILEFISDDKNFYFIFEKKLEGEFLIKNNDFLKEPDELRLFFFKILKAIQKIHKKGVIHANLCLQNIFIDSTNSPLLFGFDKSLIANSKQDSQDILFKFKKNSDPCPPEISLCSSSSSFKSNPIDLPLIDVWDCGQLFTEILKQYPAIIPNLYKNLKFGDYAFSEKSISTNSRKLISLLNGMLSKDLTSRLTIEDCNLSQELSQLDNN